MSESGRPRPIYSSFADDPAYTHRIDAFVLRVAERIDNLQDADIRGDLEALARLASDLGRDARAVGYEALARGAAVVEAACLADEAKEAHAGIVELTAIARLVRLGHRGAMA
jgi:hypothetical protein